MNQFPIRFDEILMHCLAGSHKKKILLLGGIQPSYNKDPLTNT